MLTRLIRWTKKHKFLSLLIALSLIFGVYYVFFRSDSAIAQQYIMGTVNRGAIAVSVTGSGQVSVSSQLDLKPKASGEVIWLGAKKGQFVGSGAVIAKLDSKDAEKSVRDAQVNLET